MHVVKPESTAWNMSWVVTNCIDKKSSAELSKAINSMFSWYRNVYVTTSYLLRMSIRRGQELLGLECADMPPRYVEHFCQSRWFTR